MIKILTKIFLVYLILLAVLPCSDVCSTSACTSQGIVHVEEPHSDAHADLCSPLCNCLCCNTIVSVSGNYHLQASFNSTYYHASQTFDVTPSVLNPASPPPKA